MALLDAPLRDLARRLRAGEVSAAALAREAAERMEASEAALGAYKLPAPERAAAAAREADAAFEAGRDLGLFQGIPVAVKDLYGIPGLPTFAGTPRELPASWQEPGPLVRCLLEESAVVVGKTHTVEFAFGALGINNHWPTPRNPWDAAQHRAPGGSSSGAGVALCQGSAVVSLGSDTAGSVRIPATLTGNVGYKPTVGRWSTDGIVPLSRFFDTPGMLARSVDDAVAAAREFDRRFGLGGAPVHPAGALRIGVPEAFFFEDCDGGIAEGVRAALAELERAGHRLVPFDFPEAAAAFEVFRAGATSGVELLAFLRRELPAWIETLDPYVGARVKAVAELTAVELLDRKLALDALARAARQRFEEVDVVVTPTTPETPPVLAAIPGWEAYRPLNLRMVRNSCVANLLQLAGLTMPVALDAARMPVGLQVMAGHGADERLFAAALAFEKVLGTGRQRIGAPPAYRLAASAAAT